MTKPFDTTGRNPLNLVAGEASGVPTSKALWPQEGVFYRNGLKLTATLLDDGGDVELHYGDGYSLSPSLLTASAGAGGEVFSYLLLDTPELYAGTSLNYQAVGGDTKDMTLLTEILSLGTFDVFDGDVWASLSGEHLVSNAVSSYGELVKGGPLELVQTRLTHIQEELERDIPLLDHGQILRDFERDKVQDRIIDAIKAVDAEQDIALTTLFGLVGSGVTPNTELLKIEAAQRLVIDSTTSLLTVLKASVTSISAIDDQQDLDIIGVQDADAALDTRTASISLDVDQYATDVAVEEANIGALVSGIRGSLTFAEDRQDAIRLSDVAQDTTLGTINSLLVAATSANTITYGEVQAAVSAINTLVAATNTLLSDLVDMIAWDQTQTDRIAVVAATAASLASGGAGGSPLGDAIAAADANTAADLVQAATIVSLANEDVIQDANIVSLTGDVANLMVDLVDLTPVEVAISTNNSEIQEALTDTSDITARNVIQDESILSLTADIADMQVNGVSVNTSELEAGITANAEALALVTADIRAAKITDSLQSQYTAQQEQDLYLLEQGFTLDLSEFITAANIVSGKLDALTVRVDYDTGVNVDQDSRISQLSTDYTGLDGPALDYATLLTQISSTDASLDGYLIDLNTEEGTDGTQTLQAETNSSDIDALIATGGGGGTDMRPFYLRSNMVRIALKDDEALAISSIDNTDANVRQDAELADILNKETEQDASLDKLETCLASLESYADPIITYPIGPITVSTPLATSSDFLPKMPMDAHVSSDWQLSKRDDFSLLLPIIIPEGYGTLTSIILDANLEEGVVYYLRVRYVAHSGITDWSIPVSFSWTTP